MKKTMLVVVFLMSAILSFGQTATQVRIINPSKDTVINKEVAKSFDKNVKIISVQNDSIAAMKKRMHDAVSKDLYNGILPIHYLMAFIFTMIGMFIRWSYALTKVVKANNDPANKFSWNLWAQGTLHKIMRVIATIFLVFIFLRFSNEILGYAFSMFVAFCIGFFIDFLADKFMQLKPDTIFKKETPTV